MKVHYLGALSKSQSWPAGPWSDQTFWQWNRLLLWDFTEKPSPLCVKFRIWRIWMVSFDWKWNSHYDGNGLAGQFWQMESALGSHQGRLMIQPGVWNQTKGGSGPIKGDFLISIASVLIGYDVLWVDYSCSTVRTLKVLILQKTL